MVWCGVVGCGVVWCGGSLDNLILMMLGIGGIVFVEVQQNYSVRLVALCDCYCIEQWNY